MDDSQAGFYRPVDQTQLSQGDVFRCVPLVHFRLNDPPVKEVMFPGGRKGYEHDQVAVTADTPAKERTKRLVVAECDYTQAVLLTYDCEIDKPATKQLTFAVVRLMTGLDPKTAQGLRENRKLSAFYLPPASDGEPETYVDFRRLATVSPELAKQSERVRSISDTSIAAMPAQFIRFVTRRDIALGEMPKMPDCN